MKRGPKDLRSVQNIVIISIKFPYFRYLNICLKTFVKELLPQLLDITHSSIRYLDNRAKDV